MANFAAIDVGSNAIRMLVSRLEGNGKLETLENIRLPVRLGQDAFTTGQLSEQSMRMAVDAFIRFRQVAELFKVSQSRAIATSAMREATNRDLLVDRIQQETGFMVEVISGEEEARLIHLAVRQAVDLHAKIGLLIDIGGGSIEVVLCNGDHILSTASFDMGTVRLLNLLKDQNDQKQPVASLLREYTETARRYIDQEVAGYRVQVCVGTGGNLEELGRLRKRLLKKQRNDLVTVEDLERFNALLSTMSYEQRMQKLGLNPDRADVILPAIIVLQMITREIRVKEVVVPGVGLKDGVMIDLLPPAVVPSMPRRTQVLASVEQMGKKYAYDADHAGATARLAVQLFDQTLSLHHLTENERLLLETAAWLHDIGHFINTIDHDQHGYYLLENHALIGLTKSEQEIVANLVLYHRKQAPTLSEDHPPSLSRKDRVTLTKLLSILRLADALDSSHLGRVTDISLEQVSQGVWRLYLHSSGEAMLEKWELSKRKTLFEDVYGIKLQVM